MMTSVDQHLAKLDQEQASLVAMRERWQTELAQLKTKWEGLALQKLRGDAWAAKEIEQLEIRMKMLREDIDRVPGALKRLTEFADREEHRRPQIVAATDKLRELKAERERLINKVESAVLQLAEHARLYLDHSRECYAAAFGAEDPQASRFQQSDVRLFDFVCLRFESLFRGMPRGSNFRRGMSLAEIERATLLPAPEPAEEVTTADDATAAAD